MSYNTLSIKKEGFPIITDKVVKELYKLKEDIFSNGQHKGKSFEVVFEAYCQIKKHYGKPKPSTMCKSGCIKQMNDILKNWFKAYEADGGKIPSQGNNTLVGLAMSASQNGSLVTINDRRKKLESQDWGDLKQELKDKIGEDAFKLINGKKPAKKIQVIEELLKLS